MSSRNRAQRLDIIERNIGQSSDLIIEIFPDCFFLSIGELAKHPKCYGLDLLTLVLADPHPNIRIIHPTVPRKGLFRVKKPIVKKHVIKKHTTRKENEK